jgi:predicted HicB family RNase H-like nuclease
MRGRQEEVFFFEKRTKKLLSVRGWWRGSRSGAGQGERVMLEYKTYIGTVEADDGIFVGRVSGLRDVIHFEGTTFTEVEQAFRDSIDDYLAFCAARGEVPDRPYSGKIPLRVDPELHRRAAAVAQANGVSLNQWIAQRIEAHV